jgi:serine protease inhibitor
VTGKFIINNSKEFSLTFLPDTKELRRISYEFNFIKDKNQPAWIDQINQTSRISLDEDGIEASNFTEVVMYGAPPPPDEIVEFNLDRPFILLIRGTSRNAIFMAVVNQMN